METTTINADRLRLRDRIRFPGVLGWVKVKRIVQPADEKAHKRGAIVVLGEAVGARLSTNRDTGVEVAFPRPKVTNRKQYWTRARPRPQFKKAEAEAE